MISKNLVIGSLLSLCFIFGAYAWSWLTATTGDTLTADKWNEMVAKLVPSWIVSSFNLSSCPEGWSEYTPAYGRFIRWIDKSGTSIDPSGQRALWNIQNDAFWSHNHYTSFHNDDWNWRGWWNRSLEDDDGGWYNVNTSSTWDSETRPKNVALLYCQKD